MPLGRICSHPVIAETCTWRKGFSSDPYRLTNAPEYYPSSEYLRLFRLIDSRLAAIICNLAPFHNTPFDAIAAPVREPLLIARPRRRSGRRGSLTSERSSSLLHDIGRLGD